MLVFPVTLFVCTFAARNKDYEENDSMDSSTRGWCGIGTVRAALARPDDGICGSGLYETVPVAGCADDCTIVLAVITTFATFGAQGSGKIFGRTLTYTLLTTFAAAAVGAVLYVLVAPGNLPAEAIGQGIYSKIPCLWYANNMPEVLWECEKRRTFAL